MRGLFRFSVSPFLRFVVAIMLFSLSGTASAEEPLVLQTLIDAALRNNHDVLIAESKWRASTHKIVQAESLPDPMVMIGYQNEGWNEYTFGQMEGAQWMYGLSQMFPFPGKRSLKGEMASQDAEGAGEEYRAVRLRTIARVKELYFDLFLAYRDLDLVSDKAALFSRIEAAALGRYAAGMAPQQEVLMAQTEKYMLAERETMLRQKVSSTEAMLASVLGETPETPLARPAEPAMTPFAYGRDELIEAAMDRSPEVRSRQRMQAAAQAKVRMAEKEYFPDMTLAATVFKRSGEFEDMWSVTATFNIPLYWGTKRSTVAETMSQSESTRHDLAGTKVMLTSGIRDSYSMLKTAEKLMDLYKQGLIPKTSQDFESALTGYRSGKVEAITVINRLKILLDYETLYWAQFVEREKAIARLEALTAIAEPAERRGE
jgi:outer membrane protein TolC